MNLDSLQAGALAGINGHNLRQPGHTSASIEPRLSGKNREIDMSNADWTPPDRQADTGRKIRTDARVVASFVMTLPEELGQDRLDDWIDASMTWFNSLPGKTAYAVLHMDEPGARPHIHALRIPVNDAGNLNYKRDFGGHRERLDELHESYALALEPLGVFMAHEDDRKKRRSARDPLHDFDRDPHRPRPKTRPPETPRKELVDENKAMREQLKASGLARQKDYQALKRINDSALREDEKSKQRRALVREVLARGDAAAPPAKETGSVEDPDPAPAAAAFADDIHDWMLVEETRGIDLVAENKRLRQVLKDSGLAVQQDYKDMKQAKDLDLPDNEKLIRMAEIADRVKARAAAAKTADAALGREPDPQRRSPAPVKTPTFVPAPIEDEPSFAGMLQDWMQHEAAKRQEAEARAETADRERKKQARLARAGKAARNQHKEQAGALKTAYHSLVEKYNGLVKKFTDLRETFIALTEQTFKYTSLIGAFRKTLKLADDDPRAEQLAERVVDDGVRVFDRQRKARAAEEQDPEGPVPGI